GGVAIAMEGVVILQGLTPTETQVKSLILWLTEQNHMLYVTDGLSRDYPLAVTFDNAPAGLIAILLPKTSENAILWFRREYRHQVDWAGDPDKPASLRSDGSWDLHPRGSFER
ncbi:cyanobacterial phytochrome A, partial [Candidatus Woesearchaeota archaeon]|nr:cyanobacterial phytochrome A [Candidatus Woesearchaeota archaeon]